jgi:hypothetical protein
MAAAPPERAGELPDDVQITDELLFHIAAQGAPPAARHRRLPSLRRPDGSGFHWELVAVAVAFLVIAAAIVHSLRAPLFAPTFGSSGLVTNEYAAHHPGARGAKRDDDWLVTSGSLLARHGWGWTGRPDGRAPGDGTGGSTDSAVFRAVSRRNDLRDIEVRLKLRNLGVTRTSRTPMHDWDGVNLMLRWRSQREIYYVALNRRDDQIVIKKKVAGGTVNGGWYYPLTQSQPYPVPYGKVQDIRATITNDPDGAVTIKVYFDGKLRLHANDAGVGGPPITEAGRVGLRGDNAEFLFRDFVVRGTSSKEAGSGPTPMAPSDRTIMRKDRSEPTL